MVVLTLEELKKIWPSPVLALQYTIQSLGREDEIIENYFNHLVCENGYYKDNRVHTVLNYIPWWEGNNMPCLFADYQQGRHFYTHQHAIQIRWEGRFDVLRQKARPVLYQYFKQKARKNHFNNCVKLLSMAAICTGYKGIKRAVRQFKVDTSTYRPIEASNPYLTVNVYSGIHYQEISQVLFRIEDWMSIYVILSGCICFPQELILLCAEYIEMDKLKQKWCRRQAPGTGGVKVP